MPMIIFMKLIMRMSQKDPKGLPVKVFRSKQWISGNPEKDATFIHNVLYYAGLRDLCREYLPEDLDIYLEKIYESLKRNYPVLLMSEDRKKYLERKIYFEKNATKKEIEENRNYYEQVMVLSKEFEKIKRALILKHPLIEKTVIVFKNPLIIEGYDYNTSTAFSRKGIKDLRYVTNEEVERIKSEGYDGIILEQYGWFIKFK